MVSESDFIAAFQAYHDALQDPSAKIDTIRPLVDEHLEQLISRLPGQVVQNAARKRAMDELDRIEASTKEKVEEVVEKLPSAGDDAILITPDNTESGSPITIGFSGSSGDPTAWIGIYPEDAHHGEHGTNWLYVGGGKEVGEAKTYGSVTFTEDWGAGDYEARLFRNNGHELMASSSFQIKEPPAEEAAPDDEPADTLRNAFNVFDRDGNGVIDIDELRHMMVALGEDLSEDEIQITLAEADADGDGVINFEEFKVIMMMDRSSSEPPIGEETTEEQELESEPQPVAELESTPSSSGSIADVVAHLDTLKLFGEKRRYVESLSNQVFDFNLRIEKMEKTIGIGLEDTFRGGNTYIGAIDDIGVGVRMPKTMELSVGEEVYIEAKLLEYRSVVKRFEFEQL